MTNESIFICDPHPTARWLRCARALSAQEIADVRWAERSLDLKLGAMVVLRDGVRVEFVQPEWPDAEFCAA